MRTSLSRSAWNRHSQTITCTVPWNDFAPSWRATRGTVFASEEADYGSDYSFAHMRATLRKAKDYAIEHQAELIAQFKAQAEAAGAVIYEARTAEDANRYIYELCQRKGIDLVVKSKTMVSEETELNHYLEARSIKAVETDLGEWVAQLAHERPSHMVMPIIHKTRQQVGAILAEALGREISREDVAEQVAVIRVEHRKSFDVLPVPTSARLISRWVGTPSAISTVELLDLLSLLSYTALRPGQAPRASVSVVMPANRSKAVA